MLRVLHVIPHLGGGVGRFYSRLLSSDYRFKHFFLLLEQPVDTRFLPAGNWEVYRSMKQFFSLIKAADLTQIDFWNHPALYDLLRSVRGLPTSRSLIYCHVNGLYAPSHIPIELNQLGTIVLSTYASLFTEIARTSSAEIEVIPGFGGASELIDLRKKSHKKFEILYIGTADQNKFLTESIEWSIELAKENKNFLFKYCTQDENFHLQTKIPKSLVSQFVFDRAVSDIRPFLQTADIFGYPLQPRHYGTGEQAIIEAMAVGVVPIVMNNFPERFIIDQGKTGILANNKQDYLAAVKFLYSNPKRLLAMSLNAAKDVKENKSATTTVERFHKLYSRLIAKPKQKRLSPFYRKRIFSLFCLSQGEAGLIFKSALRKDVDSIERWLISRMIEQASSGKGSLVQWANYFTECQELKQLKNIFFEPNFLKD